MHRPVTGDVCVCTRGGGGREPYLTLRWRGEGRGGREGRGGG